MKLIYEKSHPGRRAGRPPRPEGLPAAEVPAELARAEPPRLPELAEPDLCATSPSSRQRNYGIDTGFYPLGSCTMKHNPRINERLAALPGFRDLHPHQEEDGAQGALRVCCASCRRRSPRSPASTPSRSSRRPGPRAS